MAEAIVNTTVPDPVNTSPENPEEELPYTNIMELPPEEVKGMWKRKEISDDKAQDYIAIKKAQNHEQGVFGLDPADAKRLYKRGLMTEDQAKTYIDYKKRLEAGPEGSEEDGFMMKGLKKTGSFMLNSLRPFGALEAFAVGPIGHEYESETVFGKFLEAFEVAGKSAYDELFPGETRENIEGKVLDRFAPDMPEQYRVASEIAIGFLGDPAILGAAFYKSLKAGLRVSAMQKSESGPFRRTIEDLVSFVPMEDAEFKRLAALADQADAGDKAAAKALAEETQDHKVFDKVRAEDSADLSFNIFSEAKGQKEKAIKAEADKGLYATSKQPHPFEVTDTMLVNIEKADKNAATVLLDAVNQYSKDVLKNTRNQAVQNKAAIKKAGTQAARDFARLTGKSTKKAEGVLGFGSELLDDIKGASAKANALNRMFTGYGKAVDKLIDTATSVNGSLADELRAMEHINVLAELQNLVYGVRAEFGRGLGIYRYWDEGSRFNFSKLDTGVMDEISKVERGNIQKTLKMFRDQKDSGKKLRTARNLGKNRFLLGVLEWEQASLLWHYKTQMVNISGNTLAISLHALNRVSGLTMNAWMKGGGWKKPLTFEQQELKKIMKFTHGLGHGVKESLRLPLSPKQWSMESDKVGKAWKALWAGEGQLDKMMKYEGMENGAIPMEGMLKPLGVLLRMPFHGLAAGDEIFKNVAYHSELYQEAFERTIARNVAPDEVGTAMANLIKNMPSDLHYQALEQARYLTFSNDLGEAGTGIQKALGTKIGLAGRIAVLPFFKIVANLSKFGVHMTPLGAASKFQREMFAAGGAKRYELLSRWMSGMSLMYAGFHMYESGQVQGRISSEDREAFRNHDILEYSIKKDDKTFAFDRYDPVMLPFAIGADLAQAYAIQQDYNDPLINVDGHLDLFTDVIGAYMLAFTQPLLNKSYMQSVKEPIRAITEPDRMDWYKVGRNQVKKFIPRAFDVYHDVQGNNEEVRQVFDLVDVLYSKVDPSKLHQGRHAIYGTPMKRTPNFLGMSRASEIPDDKVTETLLHNEISIQAPKIDRISFEGEKLDLTPEEFMEYQDRISRTGLKEVLEFLVDNPGFKQVGREEKASIVRENVSSARAAALASMVKNDEKLMDSWREKAIRRAERTLEANNPKTHVTKRLERFLNLIEDGE
ncbi:hypothetical protein ACFL6N_06165 [Thermodesulfobacteriota bacterium]